MHRHIEEYVVDLEVLGAEESALDVRIEDHVLSVRAPANAGTSTDALCVHGEFDDGVFTRSFRIPDNADADTIQAHLKNGMLRLVMPKREETRPRRINVHAG